MACSKIHGIGCSGEVDVLALRLGGLVLLFQLVDLGYRRLFQFVDFHAHGLLLFGSNVAEIGHESVYLAFLAEVFQSQFFNFFGVLCREIAYFAQQIFYFLK